MKVEYFEKKPTNMDNVYENVLTDAFSTIISGIVPSDDVPKDEYGLWFAEMLGESLANVFIENDELTIEEAIDVAMRLGRRISYNPKHLMG